MTTESQALAALVLALGGPVTIPAELLEHAGEVRLERLPGGSAKLSRRAHLECRAECRGRICWSAASVIGLGGKQVPSAVQDE